MTELIYIDGLPPVTGKGGILRLLIEKGGLAKARIGKIVLNGGMATVEIPDGWASRLVRTLDGIQVESRLIRVWQQAPTGNQPRFDQLRRWLDWEARAEQEQSARQNEATLTRLVIRSEEIGLGERILLRLSPRNEQANLPASRLSVGSPIILRQKEATASWRGIVSKLTRRMIEIAVAQAPEVDSDNPTFEIEAASDEIARQRMLRALVRVETATGNRTAVLRDVLLGRAAAEFDTSRLTPATDPYLDHLNESQKAAVLHALSAEDVAVIHGPPGTGKTTAVVALITAAVARGNTVLACAPSNLAVDNMVERLVALQVPVVRIGHPMRVLESVQAVTLDSLVEQHDNYRMAKKIRKEAFGLQNEAGKFRRARPEKGAKTALRREAGELLDEARRLEALAVEQVLNGAAVVLSTLTAIDSKILGQRQFDWGVIDEAGQSIEPATWIAVPRVDRLILAGDHQQLPPTIISQRAADAGLSSSLLEQLMTRDGGVLGRRLQVQYRMHEQIMAFSSTEFYDGSLQAAAMVAGHRLSELIGVGENDLTQTAVTFIDTAGASYDEIQPPDSRSTANPQEAALAVRKVKQLLDAAVPAEQIAVITPYSAQVDLLRELLPDGVEVGSVDGFQGREKEAVIISLVRSNRSGQVGFLAETRRMNVALTRARRKLMVIGDSGTITSHPFYGRMLDYFDSIGAYHSVWEEDML